MQKESINPPQLFDSRTSGFSQLVVAEGKRTVYFSGQVAWGPERDILGTDLAVQLDAAFKNLQIAAAAAGGGLDNVVSLRIYIVQSHMHENASVRDALQRYFPGDAPPASTWIGVAGLAHPDFLVEIEATAVLD